MPTMVQRYQCGACEDIHETNVDAGVCYFNDTSQTPMDRERPEPQVITVDRWECDGDGCQALFEDQWSAQACETSHETEGAEGRSGRGGLVEEVGKGLTSMGLWQAGHLFTKSAGRRND